MFMFKPQRLSHALSAFDHAARRWAAIPLGPHAPSTTQAPSSSSRTAADRRPIGKQLTLTSWNINSVSHHKRVERSELILDHILRAPKSSDIIFLQEVTPSVRQSLLDDPRVRSSFLTTDAGDDTAFRGVPFVTMTLLSNERFVTPSRTEKDEDDGEGEGKRQGQGQAQGGSAMVLDSVFRMTFPSRHNRDALCVDIRDPAAPATVLRLLNVHLDSLDSCFRRYLEVRLLNDLLREDRSGGGVIAGDFNAIYPEDDTLADEHGLVDAWVALQQQSRTAPDADDGGATWGVGVELEDGHKPLRLDKVVMLGLEPVTIEVLRPGFIDPGVPWSDHCGLRCTFAV